MKLFGTDGIRGEYGSFPITKEDIFYLGQSLVEVLKIKNEDQLFIISNDGRESGIFLQDSLSSGIRNAGGTVILVGINPTPMVSYVTKHTYENFSGDYKTKIQNISCFGIQVTASHNPYYDNGLKLFGPDGLKLSDRIEKKIEKLIDSKITSNLSKPEKLGREKRLEDANDKYIEILKNNFPKNFSLKGMKIAIDCANGAAYKTGPKLLKSLGAKVYQIGTSPNGLNINKNCGSTFPKKIKSIVKKHKVNLGIALDGDADRVILCDEKGNIVDGDQIIAMLADRWKRKKILRGGVIGTLMSNYGLQNYFREKKIKFIRANVGDRYVKEKMQKNNYNLGGEQSGHIILGKFATTGDGLLVALEALFALRKGKKASEFFKKFKKTPQLLQNIEVKDKSIINKASIKKSIKIAEKLIKGQGRILVRKSGTESKIIFDPSYLRKCPLVGEAWCPSWVICPELLILIAVVEP